MTLKDNAGFTIPTDLREIGPRLLSLNLTRCSLIGQVPDSIVSLTQARSILLDGNHFKGPLSLNIILFIVRMRYKGCTFSLNDSGLLTLPLNLEKLASEESSECAHLDLSYCSLVGNIPTSIAALKFLTFLSLEGNKFDCEMPVGLLDIVQNMRQNGKSVNLANAGKLRLPSNLQDLAMLQGPSSKSGTALGMGDKNGIIYQSWKLDLRFCSLSGEIPRSISAFKQLKSENRRNVPLELNLTGNEISEQLPLSIARLTNLTSISMSFDGTSVGGTSLDYPSMLRYLLRDIAIGVYNDKIDELQEELERDPEKILWKAMLTSTFTALEDKIKQVVARNRDMLIAVDLAGRMCMDVATPSMSIAAKSGALFCWRYDVLKEPPVHSSDSCVVIRAIDRGYEMKLRSFFWANYSTKQKLFDADAAVALASINLIEESVVGSSSVKDGNKASVPVAASEDSFVRLCEQYIRTIFRAELVPIVALKFFHSKNYFVREVMVRSSAEFDDHYVVDINKEDELRVLTEALDLYPPFCCNGYEKFQHVIVLQDVGRSLKEVVVVWIKIIISSLF